MDNATCRKCLKHGLSFYSNNNITPVDYIEGKRNADIWIVVDLRQKLQREKS